MSLVRAVEVPRRPVYRLELIIGAARYGRVAGAAARLRQVLAGRSRRVDRLACGLGEQVRPGSRHDLDQLIPSAAGQQPAGAAMTCGCLDGS